VKRPARWGRLTVFDDGAGFCQCFVELSEVTQVADEEAPVQQHFGRVGVVLVGERLSQAVTLCAVERDAVLDPRNKDGVRTDVAASIQARDRLSVVLAGDTGADEDNCENECSRHGKGCSGPTACASGDQRAVPVWWDCHSSLACSTLIGMNKGVGSRFQSSRMECCPAADALLDMFELVRGESEAGIDVRDNGPKRRGTKAWFDVRAEGTLVPALKLIEEFCVRHVSAFPIHRAFPTHKSSRCGSGVRRFSTVSQEPL
jgi:hypothetical protein